MSTPFNRQELLSELAESIRLREGANGISKALWHIHRGSAHSIHEWSKAVQLPVPVLAAFRRELEKRDILKLETRIVVSDNGKEILHFLFHSREIPNSHCMTCNGLGMITPSEVSGLIEEMRTIGENRPTVDVTLDQSHATPETSIRKAILLLEQGLLQNSLLFMGDDDLISLACYMIRKKYMHSDSGLGEICVLDMDERYLKYIEEISKGEIQTKQYDVRSKLPDEYRGEFQTALTDPAYTLNGVTTFAARCAQATTPDATLYLSMPKVDPQMSGQIQTNMLNMGYTLRGQYNHFNEYTGASIHAHVSSLYIWEKWNPDSLHDFIPNLEFSKFYTAERRKN